MKTTAQKTWATLGRALILAATVKVVFALNASRRSSDFVPTGGDAQRHQVASR